MIVARQARLLLGWISALATLVLALAIAVGFFGEQVHAFDSIAHFRAHLAVLAACLAGFALIRRHWIMAAIGLASAALGLVTTLPFLMPIRSEGAVADALPSYTLLQMNVRFNAGEKTEAVQRIADSKADIVTLQEVNSEWRSLFETLAAAYPFQAYCGSYGTGGTAILSRRPFIEASATDLCRARDGLIVRSIDLNGQPVTVASLHLQWPWPFRHWRQIERLGLTLPNLPQPSLLAGDFNAAPWSAAVGAVAKEGGWRVQHGIGPSWMNGEWPVISAAWFGLPIDNLLVSPEIAVTSVRTLQPTTSDHLPVLVRFSLPRAAPEPLVGVATRASKAAPPA